MFFLSTETSYVAVFFVAVLVWGLGDDSLGEEHFLCTQGPTPSAHSKSQALQSLGEAEAGES